MPAVRTEEIQFLHSKVSHPSPISHVTVFDKHWGILGDSLGRSEILTA